MLVPDWIPVAIQRLAHFSTADRALSAVAGRRLGRAGPSPSMGRAHVLMQPDEVPYLAAGPAPARRRCAQ